MKTLRFFYRMAFHYNQPVKGHYIFLRCFPKNTVRQHIEELDYTIERVADMAFDNDHFGNRTADCLIAQPHSGIQVMIRGKVRTGLDIYEDLESDSMKACLFRYPSKYTQPGDALKAYHQELALDTIDGDYEKVLCIMRNLSERMRYEKDVTDINTTAEEANAFGCVSVRITLILCWHSPNGADSVRYVGGVVAGRRRDPRKGRNSVQRILVRFCSDQQPSGQ